MERLLRRRICQTNKDKVYLKGYVIGRAADTLGYNGLMVQLENLDVVEIDKNLMHRDINEPQKVQVPQFVADWYEANKDDFETKLFNTIGLVIRDFEDGDLSAFEEWIVDGRTAPFQALVNMHQFGYTVEKEKRYVVSLKNGQPLVKSQSGSALYFSQDITAGNYKVTLKELEETSLGDVFYSPLFEVEEVTE